MVALRLLPPRVPRRLFRHIIKTAALFLRLNGDIDIMSTISLKRRTGMAKKLVLITQAASTCPTYAQRLHQFFGSNIALECFSVEAGDFPAMPTDADLYINDY